MPDFNLEKFNAARSEWILWAGKHRPALTYSQCGEDMIIGFLLHSIKYDYKAITYLEIGACHPTCFSNTCMFYIAERQGVLIEPDPEMFQILKKVRPRDTCLWAAVRLEGTDTTAALTLRAEPSLNSLYKPGTQENSDGQEIMVPLLDVNTVLAEHFKRPPTIISVDIEGGDYALVKQIDMTRGAPLIFCIERSHVTDDDLAGYLVGHGYSLAAQTPINMIFMRAAQYHDMYR